MFCHHNSAFTSYFNKCRPLSPHRFHYPNKCSVLITQSFVMHYLKPLTLSFLSTFTNWSTFLRLLQYKVFPQSTKPCSMPIHETNVKFFLLYIFNILESKWDSNSFHTKHALTEFIRSHTREDKWREVIQNKQHLACQTYQADWNESFTCDSHMRGTHSLKHIHILGKISSCIIP